MDRQRLDLLTVQANALATALIGIPDSDDKARQRCLNYSGEIKGFVKALSNLSRALDDPQLEARPAFAKIIDRLLTDTSKIINDLRSQLALVRNKQEQYDAAYRGKRWVPGRHKTAHLLVSFLSGETTTLRLQQIIYAVSVLDVILGVVLHAKTLGTEPATQQDAQASMRDQFTRLRAESEAKATVFREERQVGDKAILTSAWLNTVTWHPDANERPPFETLALQWFEIAPDHVHHGTESQISIDANTQELARLVIQLQHEVRDQAHQHSRTRSWAETNIRQLEEKQQKTEKDGAARIEELRNQVEVQQLKMDADTVTIERLDHARKSWSSHAQKQSEKLQHLETDMKDLQKRCNQQQEKIDAMQLKQDKLIQQNQALRQRLEQAETEKDALAEKYYKLQTRHSEIVKRDKQWTAYYESNKDRDAQIKKLQAEIRVAKDEIAELKLDLADAEGSCDELRNSLTTVKSQRDVERQRADGYKARLSSPRKDCPSSFENRQSRRGSSSRHRSESSASAGTSRAPSRESHSRGSSATYVDDNASDQEYYGERVRQRRGSKNSTVGAWFSPVRRQEAVV